MLSSFFLWKWISIFTKTIKHETEINIQTCPCGISCFRSLSNCKSQQREAKQGQSQTHIFNYYYDLLSQAEVYFNVFSSRPAFILWQHFDMSADELDIISKFIALFMSSQTATCHLLDLAHLCRRTLVVKVICNTKETLKQIEIIRFSKNYLASLTSFIVTLPPKLTDCRNKVYFMPCILSFVIGQAPLRLPTKFPIRLKWYQKAIYFHIC